MRIYGKLVVKQQDEKNRHLLAYYSGLNSLSSSKILGLYV